MYDADASYGTYRDIPTSLLRGNEKYISVADFDHF